MPQLQSALRLLDVNHHAIVVGSIVKNPTTLSVEVTARPGQLYSSGSIDQECLGQRVSGAKHRSKTPGLGPSLHRAEFARIGDPDAVIEPPVHR